MKIVKLSISGRFTKPEECRSPILLSSNPPDLIKILHLLSGGAIITDVDTDILVYSGERNFINPDQNLEIFGLNHILDYLFDERPGDAELVSIFSRLSSRNRGFYAEILEELPFLLKALDNQNFEECFVYMYRLLERISVACPLIFASRESDFRGAHNFLSTLFGEKKSPGELGMLKKFLHRYAEGNENFRAATLDFDASTYDYDFATELFSQLRANVANEVTSVSFDDDQRTFSVPYKDVASFVAAVRNRAFHNHSDQSNFRLGKLGGSQALFGALVPSLLQWFSYVFVDLAKWQISGVS